MGLENTPINSKACVNCNNAEGDLISVCLEGLQSLMEYRKNSFKCKSVELPYGTSEK